MASCCTVTYVVVAGIAAVLAIVACSVPLFVITDNNEYDGGDGGKRSAGFMASGHVGQFGTKASSGRPLRREAQPLSTTDLKCPLFGGQCTGDSVSGTTMSTRDVLHIFSCDGHLDGARALAVIAVMGAGATTLLAVVGISRMQGPRVRLYKFGCVFLGGIGWVCGAVGFNVQLSIRRCLEDSYGFVQLYNGQYMVMVSAIVTAIFTAILFFATISMLSSWWCGCCGDQPGSYYVNYGPGQQGPYQQQQQQQYAYGQPLVAGAVQGYPGQQPVMGSPTGQLQPQQYAPAPGTAYGQPTQQYGYQQAPQYAQYPQQQQQAYQQAPQYAQYPQYQQPQYPQQQQQPMPPHQQEPMLPQQQQQPPPNGCSA